MSMDKENAWHLRRLNISRTHTPLLSLSRLRVELTFHPPTPTRPLRVRTNNTLQSKILMRCLKSRLLCLGMLACKIKDAHTAQQKNPLRSTVRSSS